MGLLLNAAVDPVTLLLIDTLAQVTVISLVALLVMRTVARRSPAARHGIGLCALFCVLSSPAIAGGVERVGRPETGSLLWIPPMDGEALAVIRSAQENSSLHPVTAVVLLIWLVGVLWQVARFAAGGAWLVRIRQSVSPFELGGRAGVLDEVRVAMGRSCVPDLGVSPLVRGPVVLGPFRPMIVLPTGMERSLDDPSLRDVLIHEWAHLVQHHHVLGCVQRCVATLFWPHPLVNALCRDLGQSAEELCDNFVLRHSEAPQYARTLLTVATAGTPEPMRQNAVVPSITKRNLPARSRWSLSLRTRSAGPGKLVTRVEGLLDRRRERRTQWDLWKQVVLTSLFLAIATSVSAMRVSQAASRPERSVRNQTARPKNPGHKASQKRMGIPSLRPQSTPTGSAGSELHR